MHPTSPIKIGLGYCAESFWLKDSRGKKIPPPQAIGKCQQILKDLGQELGIGVEIKLLPEEFTHYPKITTEQYDAIVFYQPDYPGHAIGGCYYPGDGNSIYNNQLVGVLDHYPTAQKIRQVWAIIEHNSCRRRQQGQSCSEKCLIRSPTQEWWGLAFTDAENKLTYNKEELKKAIQAIAQLKLPGCVPLELPWKEEKKEAESKISKWFNYFHM